MRIADYTELIRNLPVRQQCFRTKRRTWEKAEGKIPWLMALNDQIFYQQKAVTISRQDIFATSEIRELIVKTIYWGYPGGMRGNHAINIFCAIEDIEMEFKLARNGERQQSIGPSNLTHLLSRFQRLKGLGIATLTKLLYFSSLTFEGYPCLILDSRIITLLQEGKFVELHMLRNIRYSKSIELYTHYLRIMSEVSERLDVSTENLEQFLFLFGGYVKPSKLN